MAVFSSNSVRLWLKKLVIDLYLVYSGCLPPFLLLDFCCRRVVGAIVIVFWGGISGKLFDCACKKDGGSFQQSSNDMGDEAVAAD